MITMRLLPVKLTRDELDQRGRDLARFTREKDETELKKSEVAKQLSATIASCVANISKLAQSINTGVEYRDVKCVWKYNFPLGKKYLIREDTCEQIEAKDISLEDRQRKVGDGDLHQEEVPFHESPEYPSETEPGRVTKVKDDELTDGDPVAATAESEGTEVAASQDPEEQTGDTIQPNENGVFMVEPMFSYESKKAKADIMIIQYQGKWYKGINYEVKSAGGGGGSPSANRTAYGTAEEALDAAKQQLIGSLDSIIIVHPDKRPAVKKVIVWAEGLTMSDSNVQEKKPAQDETTEGQVQADLDLQIEFLAQRSQNQDAELEQVKDWFSEVVTKVIAESFPRFTYIKAEEVLEWLDTVISLCGGINGNESLLDELRVIMANRKGYNECILQYIDENDLQPDNLIDQTGETAGEAA